MLSTRSDAGKAARTYISGREWKEEEEKEACRAAAAADGEGGGCGCGWVGREGGREAGRRVPCLCSIVCMCVRRKESEDDALRACTYT